MDSLPYLAGENVLVDFATASVRYFQGAINLKRYCREMSKLWDAHVQAFEQGEQNYNKRSAEGLQKLEEIKAKISEIHTKTTASEQPAELDEEDPDLPTSTINIKKMRDAMSAALTTM